jgi:hypothetical protein
VVVEHSQRAVEQAIAVRRFLNYPGALDLLVRTPDELRRRLTLGDWFLRDILEYGTVLYERSHS